MQVQQRQWCRPSSAEVKAPSRRRPALDSGPQLGCLQRPLQRQGAARAQERVALHDEAGQKPAGQSLRRSMNAYAFGIFLTALAFPRRSTRNAKARARGQRVDVEAAADDPRKQLNGGVEDVAEALELRNTSGHCAVRGLRRPRSGRGRLRGEPHGRD